MKRPLRDADDFNKKLEADPDLRSLHEQLTRDERLLVVPDGVNSSLFKVYVKPQTGPNQGFLRAITPLDESEVDWSVQPPSCRREFATIVRNAQNPRTSKLKHGTTVEAVVEAVTAYADAIANEKSE